MDFTTFQGRVSGFVPEQTSTQSAQEQFNDQFNGSNFETTSNSNGGFTVAFGHFRAEFRPRGGFEFTDFTPQA